MTANFKEQNKDCTGHRVTTTKVVACYTSFLKNMSRNMLENAIRASRGAVGLVRLLTVCRSID